METAIGIIAGAIISAGTGWWFARKSAHELARETEKIRLHNEILMRALENADLGIKFNRGEHGRIIGTIVNMKADGTIHSSGSAEIEVIRRGDARDLSSREEG